MELFWWALGVRIVFGLLRTVITDYLVPQWGVDTTNYYASAGLIAELLFKDPRLALEMIFQPYEEYSEAARLATGGNYFFESIRTSIVIRISVLPYILTMGSYFGISLIVSGLSFFGSWLLYRTFFSFYPRYGRIMALACFFVPTVAFYGTNLYKDPICIYGLGLVTYHAFTMHRAGKITLYHLLGFVLGALVLNIIKGYIFAAFAVAFIIYWFASLKLPVRTGVYHSLLKSGVIVIGGTLVISSMGLYLTLLSGRYSIDSILLRMEYLNGEESRVGGKVGSVYELPPLSFSPDGIFRFVLASYNVSLFRPYPWEVNGMGPLILFLESFPTLLLTLFIMVRTYFFNVFIQIYKDRFLLFCFVFSFVFLTITGAFSPSFGALCRYKIPGFPFFVVIIGVVLMRQLKGELPAAQLRPA